jgi:hypothetical protein
VVQSGVATSPATRSVSPSSTTTYTITALTDAYRTAQAGDLTGSAAVTVGTIPATPSPTNNGPKCVGGFVQLSVGIVTGATYAWTGPNGFTSTQALPTLSNVTTAMAGGYSVTVTVSGCTSAPGTTNVVVNTAPATPVITAPAGTVAGTTGLTASAVSHAGSSYSWGITNGTITFGQGTSQIAFTAGTPGTPLTLSVTETNSSGCPSAAGNATVTVLRASSALPYYTVLPCRVLDTRAGSGLPAGYGPPSITGGATQRTFVIAGQCGIPAEAGAVLINATVWAPTTLGDLRVFPAGLEAPMVSTLNWGPNILALANFAIVQLGAGGAITVQVEGLGTVDIFFDVNGYFQ